MARRFWLTATLVYLTLIYATGLHLAWFPESTVRATYFNSPPDARLSEHFPDYGSRHDEPLQVVASDGWKLAGFTKDQAEYLIQSESLRDGRPPYVYRVLPTALAGALARATGIEVATAFAVLNVLCVLAAALVFTLYLQRVYAFDDLLALLGGTFVVTMVSVTRTVSYPMLEPASILAIAVVFWTVARRNVAGFVVAAACAVATKEVLAIAGPLWLLHHYERARSPRLALDVLIALWPLVVLLAIRAAVGGSVTAHDGHELLAGDLPAFAARITTAGGAFSLLERTFLSFGFMWLGLASVRAHPMLARHALIIPPVILAAFLLSQQITRVLGILFPVVLPGFLLLVVKAVRPASFTPAPCPG